MDRVEKALRRLSVKERVHLKEILQRILVGNFLYMNIMKLKGHHEIYRVRTGDLRVIYRVDKEGNTNILSVERRSDTTYNRF